MSIDFKVNIFTDGNVITTDNNGVIVDELTGKLPKLFYIVNEITKPYKQQITEHPDFILNKDRMIFVFKKFEDNEETKEHIVEENAIVVNYKQIQNFVNAMNLTVAMNVIAQQQEDAMGY